MYEGAIRDMCILLQRNDLKQRNKIPIFLLKRVKCYICKMGVALHYLESK